MSSVDTELVAEFVVESQEGLANIEQQLLAIEAAGAKPEVELVNAVFRTMHTIKGSAGFLGLDRIGALAHGLEEVLDRMRNRELATSSDLVSTILRASDYMKGLIDAIESSNEADISEHVGQLRRFMPTTGAATPSGTTVGSMPVTSGFTEGVHADVSAGESLSPSLREFLAECAESLDQIDEELVALEQNNDAPQCARVIFRGLHGLKISAELLGLKQLAQIADAAESLTARVRDGLQPLAPEVLSALLGSIDACRNALQLVALHGTDHGLESTEILNRLRSFSAIPPGCSSTTEPNPGKLELEGGSVGKSPASKVPAAIEPANERAASTGDTTIRVDVGLLDKLMTRVGELVLARNQIVQYTGRMEDAGFVSTAQRLNLITTELQESVMKTRMQPIGNVWAKFPRVVRDLAGQLGKEVRIEMEGKETELDKTIVEAIKDPLTHLVRNSIDHGLESPAARRAAGKPAEGVLLLRAYHEGGQVNIEISDDGAGLNLERIRRKGVERGLCTPDQAARMSEREVSQLIFSAGFSTAEQVTSVSGRGVGMDVVKTNIERIGGVIDLQSKPGEGTTVKIKIPLTLAIIPALIVTSQGDSYAIPQISLLELVRLEGDDARRGIEFMHGTPVYRLRGKLLPLVYLSARLGLEADAHGHQCPGSDQGAVNIVVLRADDRQFGLIVDKVCDTEEIVVKPLGKQLKKIGEYAGATIMGDGGVALILDVKGLAVASGLSGEMRTRNGADESRESLRNRQSLESVLLVDVGDSRRFALPISMVSRLEKIPSNILEQANGQAVVQYRGKILPLIKLVDVVGGSSAPADELQVVVYDHCDRRFGLVVGRIVDTCDVAQPASAGERLPPYLLGTCVIQQHVTDVINLHQIGTHSPATVFSRSQLPTVA